MLLVFALVVAAGIVIFFGFNTKTMKFAWNLKQLLGLSAFVILVPGMFSMIEANTVGIVYDPLAGGIQESTFSEGFHLKSLFSEIYSIRTTNRTTNLTVAGQTQDSIYATFEITLVYKVEAANAGLFYKVTGTQDLTQEQLNSVAKEALQSATTQYDVYAILGRDLETVRADFVTRLSTLMSTRYHLTVVSASFDDIDAGTRIEQIIQDTAEAIQQVQIAQQELEKAQVESETAIVRATAEAEVAVIAAEAQAEAEELLYSVTMNAINAIYTAQFETIEEKLAYETNPDGSVGYLSIQEVAKIVLNQLYFDTWDGTLPQVISGDSGLIIQLPTN